MEVKDTDTHCHVCPTCGRDFEHSNRSKTQCMTRVWRCNSCVIESIHGLGPKESDRAMSEKCVGCGHTIFVREQHEHQERKFCITGTCPITDFEGVNRLREAFQNFSRRDVPEFSEDGRRKLSAILRTLGIQDQHHGDVTYLRDAIFRLYRMLEQESGKEWKSLMMGVDQELRAR